MSRALVNSLAATHGERVLDEIKANPSGLTDFQIAERLGLFLSSVNAARNTLMNRGHVKASGEFRPSGRGGMAKVWVVA